MVDHPRNLVGYRGSLDDLAKEVGNLSYDQTSSFIEKLAGDLTMQALNDSKNHRVILAKELYAVARSLYDAKNHMDLAWKICEPYMKEK